MLVLGIETSCDETAAAVVKDGIEILSNEIASQSSLHAIYGGVVPELACRRHIDVIIPVIDKALKDAGVELKEIDLFAVTYGPGLVGALLIGLNAAKALAISQKKPFIGVNHIEAHLYAALFSHKGKIPLSFPCLGMVLSGGHTALVEIKEIGKYELISQTVDDAIGEAFDKTAKMVGLPYPGGPIIEKLAKAGDAKKFPFKAGSVKGLPLHFSFSGLKTAVLYAIQELTKNNSPLSQEQICDIAASFQYAAFTDVIKKALICSEEKKIRQIIFGGGVANSATLRSFFGALAPELDCFWPEATLSLDNAAMIAGLGYHKFREKKRVGDSLDLETMAALCW